MKRVVLVLIVGFLTDCSNTVKQKRSSEFDQAKIEPTFHVTYHHNKRKGSATAVFSIGVFTQLFLDEKSNIKYNGKPMELGEPAFFGGMNYELTLTNFTPVNTLTEKCIPIK